MFNIIAMLLVFDVSVLAASGFSLWMAHYPKTKWTFPGRWIVQIAGYSRLKTVHKIAGIILIILVLIHTSL